MPESRVPTIRAEVWTVEPDIVFVDIECDDGVVRQLKGGEQIVVIRAKQT